MLFPEGGSQPFAPSSFYPALVGALFILAVIPPARRMLRIGALLYAAALVGAYVLPTAVGGNADRLGALFAGPVAACVLAARGRSAAPPAGGGRAAADLLAGERAGGRLPRRRTRTRR